MINFKNELNEEQLQAVEHGDGPCLVLAGAGSGKTRVITYRVAYLLEQGVKPENILLVTFTNKAAREMIGRLRLLVEPDPTLPSPHRGGNLLPWSGTFHHIGYRILKKYATLPGYNNNFTVLDSEDGLDLIKLCLKDEGIDRKERRFPSPAVLEDIISFARNSERTIEDVLDLKHPHFLPVSETIVRIFEDYQKRKLAANVMDFDDLLVNWHLLLIKERSVKDKFGEQFRYILVDEYQDTNKIQASIINLLASTHKNILVVGDDAQSIYSFRAAEIKNILDFEKTYPNAKVFRLETNYRSTPDILNLANSIISNNLNQYEKNLQSIQERFTKPELYSFQNQNEEAEFIANRIEELQSEGVPMNQIAVLFRAAHHSQVLEMELSKRGVAYDYRGGVRFFERAHIKDVLAYLRILNNINDEVAWRRVLNMQIGIGTVVAERIIEYVRNTKNCEITKYENADRIGAQLPAKAQVGWNDFLQIYDEMKKIENKNPADLIRAAVESKYVEYLENEYPDYRERMQDIEQLSAFARNQNDLHTFLAETSLHEGFRRVDNVEMSHASSLPSDEKIILSTIHQAKGLEWEAVFVINLAEGQFPNNLAMRERGGLEEERRLFYVAVTRAKKHLYLSYPFSTISNFLQGPSMFLEEIDSELVQGDLFSRRNSFANEEIVYVAEDQINNKKRSGFLKDISEL